MKNIAFLFCSCLMLFACSGGDASDNSAKPSAIRLDTEHLLSHEGLFRNTAINETTTTYYGQVLRSMNTQPN